MNKTLLDTDTFSEVIKGKNLRVYVKAQTYFEEFEKYTVSALTVYEILWGFQKQRMEERTQDFLVKLSYVEILDFDTETAMIASQIYGDLQRVGTPLEHLNVLIAATALRHNLTLTTGNTRHHQRIVDLGYALVVDNWKTI